MSAPVATFIEALSQAPMKIVTMPINMVLDYVSSPSIRSSIDPSLSSTSSFGANIVTPTTHAKHSIIPIISGIVNFSPRKHTARRLVHRGEV